MNSLERDLALATGDESPALALRQFVIARLSDGADRQALFQELEALRAGADTASEDVILEVLDFMQGWCSPLMKI